MIARAGPLQYRHGCCGIDAAAAVSTRPLRYRRGHCSIDVAAVHGGRGRCVIDGAAAALTRPLWYRRGRCGISAAAVVSMRKSIWKVNGNRHESQKKERSFYILVATDIVSNGPQGYFSEWLTRILKIIEITDLSTYRFHGFFKHVSHEHI